MAMLQGNIRSALIEGSTSTLVSGLSPDDIDHSSSFFSHTASVEEDEMLDKPVSNEMDGNFAMSNSFVGRLRRDISRILSTITPRGEFRQRIQSLP